MNETTPRTSLEEGIEIIRNAAKDLPESPGVYRMLNAADELLYVGKAKALKRRVISYSQPERLTLRLKRMVAETKRMEFVHVHTEIEALLLEANLIKQLRPRYNILLKDDKSFPYIHLSSAHDFPRVTKHRGGQDEPGDYFGPFASAQAVNETVAILQRAFQLRTCSDSIFSSRTRPCLQYHIKRCSGPCVGLVDKDAYRTQVQQARDFLSGKSREVVDRFAKAMNDASERMDYEEAAAYRDRVRALAQIHLQQDINVSGIGDADIMAVVRRQGHACVQVFFFRGGQNFGNRSYFPKVSPDDDESAILSAFIPQFYESRPAPTTILVSHEVPEGDLIAQALQESHGLKKAISITAPQRGDRKRVVDFVARNAEEALVRHINDRAGTAAGLARVMEIFELEEIPERIEVYDNSHVQGTNRVGAMIVGSSDGFRKNAYRKFNIKTPGLGDDFAMMREVMTRRFSRGIAEGQKDDPDAWPGLVLIDGGVGQLNAAYEVFDELGISDDLNVVAISKGPDRNAGREWFHRRGHDPFQMPENDIGLMFLQRLRDEAHRFAIGAHRARRAKAMISSSLDEIPNIGPTRKKALLQHFGSGKAVENAGLVDLEQVPGISRAVAKIIYDHYHGS